MNQSVLLALFATALLSIPASAQVTPQPNDISKAAAAKTPSAPEQSLAIALPGSPLGIGWFFVYGYGMPSATFMPDLRKLGAGMTKVYLFWNQIEPEKDRYDWSAVDAFVNQLQSPEEALISVYSTSQWATKTPATLLPPSPAKNLEEYYQFVYALVKHCQGRVRYWENDSEPNNPVFWAGTKEEFAGQLKIFHKAVKAADPSAVVILGGYDGRFSPPDVPNAHLIPGQEVGLKFFDYVLEQGRDAFDLFDLRLYGDSYTIPARVEYVRRMMAAHGYRKPIVSTEYGGPNLFEFPENRVLAPLLQSWTQTATQGGSASQGANPIAKLYERRSTLPAQTQMFMLDCSPELQAKYQRIQSRSLVMRTLLAISAGVQKLLYWEFLNLETTHPQRDDMMILMYGKVGLMAPEGNELKRTPTADAYERMARAFDGVREVKRVEVPGRPSIYLFEVDRGKRGPLYVVWERRDQFSGEDAPAVPFEWEHPAKAATAIDALGQHVPVEVSGGKLRLRVSLTPIYMDLDR